MSEDCLFCKIIKGDIPSKRIYEDKDVVAFLDIMPLTKGHTVVVPVNHYENMLDFPESEMEKFFSVIKLLSGMLKTKLNADGFNILQNNYKAAGQIIFHMHYHIIPRFIDDDRPFIKQPKEQAKPEYFDEILMRIKS